MANKVNQIVTDRIIEQLEKGIIPWHKPWSGVYNGAISRATGKPYSLLNQLLLGRPGEYLTFKQVQDAGGKIRKGEKSSIVTYWNVKEVEEEKNGETKKKSFSFLRYYRVFHIDQCEGIEAKYANENALKPADPIQAGENIITDYRDKSGCNIVIRKSNEAYYNPVTDTIVLPIIDQYRNSEEYYSTAFHEMVHSTGHKSRLGRFKGEEKASHGKEEYSKEELVAEIGSAVLMNQTGMETEKTFNNSTGYIQSWLKALKDDPNMIVQAASKAEKAVNFILDMKSDADAEIAEPEEVKEEVVNDENEDVEPEKPSEKEEKEETQVALIPEPVIEEKPKTRKPKKTTKTTIKNGFERLAKAACKDENHPLIHGAFIDKYGLLVVMDAARAYRTTHKIEVMMAPEGEHPEVSDDVFMDFEDTSKLIPLECPDFTKLKGVKMYIFGDGLPAVNPAFLKAAVQTFPDAKIYCHKNKGTLSPIYLNSFGNGDAVIMPMRQATKLVIKKEAV